MKIRLNKALSQAGIVSRRKADFLIESGEVTVNDKRVYELGVKIDPEKDKVKIENKLIKLSKPEPIVIMFYKPKEVITSLSDSKDRICVGDFFKDFKERLYPIGRLDWDSEGMLLMTNDGDFANQVSHPKHNISKRYLVKINGKITKEQIEKLKKGVSIPRGGKVRAKSLKRLAAKSTPKYDWIEMEITEGKNRQIRKMLAQFQYDAVKLKRIAIGGLEMGSLKSGKMRILGKNEIEKIFKRKEEKKKVRQKSTKHV